jgi:RNA polymerase sigma factor (sigma-70 family)
MTSLRRESTQALATPEAPTVDAQGLQDIGRLAASDIIAWQEIWEAFCHTVYWHRCLSWMGGHHEDAEDAMHAAAVRVCQYMPAHADTVLNPQAWLHRLLYNQCMTLRRGAQRRQRHIQYVEKVETMTRTSATHWQASAEETLLQDELKTHVRTLVETLPERLKEPMMLYVFQGMRQRDIAAYLNLSHNNVRKRLQQGRDLLRGQLAQYLSGEQGAA